MKKFFLFLLASSCTSCLHMGSADGGHYSMAEVNQIAVQEILYVHHFGDRRAAAKQLKMGPTHTSWVDVDSGSYITIPTKEIVDIKIRDQYSGGSRNGGFGMGMIAGASMGVMFGLSGGAEPTDKSTFAVLGGMGLGMLGGMIGRMASRNDGVKYRVIWTNPEVPIQRAVW